MLLDCPYVVQAWTCIGTSIVPLSSICMELPISCSLELDLHRFESYQYHSSRGVVFFWFPHLLYSCQAT